MAEKTPEQIAEQAARKVIADNLDNMGEDYNPEGDPIAQLAWELGEGIEYEDGLRQLVVAAIEADRAQRAHGWPTPADPATLKPGDRVRLTGRDWSDLKGRVVVIAGVADSGPSSARTPYFYEDGLEWLIWSDDPIDYSVTKVEGD